MKKIYEKSLFVQTFSSKIEEGKVARKLYIKYGFLDYFGARKNSAGIDTVTMVRK